jgi:hypothetical protein
MWAAESNFESAGQPLTQLLVQASTHQDTAQRSLLIVQLGWKLKPNLGLTILGKVLDT